MPQWCTMLKYWSYDCYVKMKLSDCWTNQMGRRRSLLAYENFAREMKITKKGTSKKDVTATLVIRPRVLLSKSKSKRRPGTAWTAVLTEVSRNKFLDYPSFFYSLLLFPSIISVLFEIITQTRPLSRVRGEATTENNFKSSQNAFRRTA